MFVFAAMSLSVSRLILISISVFVFVCTAVRKGVRKAVQKGRAQCSAHGYTDVCKTECNLASRIYIHIYIYIYTNTTTTDKTTLIANAYIGVDICSFRMLVRILILTQLFRLTNILTKLHTASTEP